MLNEELQASQEQWNARFGSFIREGRRAMKLTQAEVCKSLNIAQSYYSYIETGRSNVDFGLAMEICSLLELNINDLVRRYKKEA